MVTYSHSTKNLGTCVACPTGDKPTGDKPTGDKPTGGKPTDGKPTGEKPPSGECKDFATMLGEDSVFTANCASNDGKI